MRYLIRPFALFWIWLKYSRGTQQADIDTAHELLRDAWAAGYRERLYEQADNFALPDEVRQFAIAIKNRAHLRAAAGLPRVIVQIGRIGITISRP